MMAMPTLTKHRPEPEPSLPTVHNPMMTISVYADLLPMEIVQDRADKKSRKRAIIGLAAVLVVILLWDGFARWQTSKEQSKLDTANAATTSLVAKQRSYTELQTVKAESKKIGQQLVALLGTDLQWDKLITSVRAAAPEGVIISSLTGSLGANSTNSTNSANQPVSAATVGKIALTGGASSQDLISTFLDNLRDITGVADARPESVTQSDGAFAYTATVTLASAALDGKYVPATPTTKAGK